jgi:hypothetical protein
MLVSVSETVSASILRLKGGVACHELHLLSINGRKPGDCAVRIPFPYNSAVALDPVMTLRKFRDDDRYYKINDIINILSTLRCVNNNINNFIDSKMYL